MLAVHDYIFQSMDTGKVLVTTFLSLSSAFDTVITLSIFIFLRIGLESRKPHYIRLLQFYTQAMIINRTLSISIDLSYGVPQSLLLYLCYLLFTMISKCSPLLKISLQTHALIFYPLLSQIFIQSRMDLNPLNSWKTDLLLIGTLAASLPQHKILNLWNLWAQQTVPNSATLPHLTLMWFLKSCLSFTNHKSANLLTIIII